MSIALSSGSLEEQTFWQLGWPFMNQSMVLLESFWWKETLQKPVCCLKNASLSIRPPKLCSLMNMMNLFWYSGIPNLTSRHLKHFETWDNRQVVSFWCLRGATMCQQCCPQISQAMLVSCFILMKNFIEYQWETTSPDHFLNADVLVLIVLSYSRLLRVGNRFTLFTSQYIKKNVWCLNVFDCWSDD